MLFRIHSTQFLLFTIRSCQQQPGRGGALRTVSQKTGFHEYSASAMNTV